MFLSGRCAMFTLPFQGFQMSAIIPHSQAPSNLMHTTSSSRSDQPPAHFNQFQTQLASPQPYHLRETFSSGKHRHHPCESSTRSGVGAGGPIRRRITRACDQCNQLRTKCDGQNACAHCVGMIIHQLRSSLWRH
jgi:hypothetical protein